MTDPTAPIAPRSRPDPALLAPAGKPLPAWIWIGLGAGALLVAAGIAWLWLWPTPEQIERRWREQADFEPLAEFPGRESNAAARRIEELAASLGISMTPVNGDEGDVPPPEPEAAGRLAASCKALRELAHGYRQSEPVLHQPPPEVAALLVAAEPVLAEVVAVLEGPEPPRWELALDKGVNAEQPPLVGHLALHRLLTLSAAEASRAGDAARAERWLAASWRLRESIDADPRLLPQLVALAELKDDLAVLRAIPQPLAGWRERLAPMPLRERTVIALRLESWAFVRTLRAGELDRYSASDPQARFLFRPYWRRGIAEYVNATDRGIARIQTQNLRSFDNRTFSAEEEARIPAWNWIARTLASSSFDAWVKAAHAELGLDLTRRTLEVRDLLRQGDAERLDRLAGEHASPLEGVRWIYRIEPEFVVIETAEPLAPVRERPLPLEVRVRR